MTDDPLEAALRPLFEAAASAAVRAIGDGSSGIWAVLGGDLPGSFVSITSFAGNEGSAMFWRRTFQYVVPIFVIVHGSLTRSRNPWTVSMDLESENDTAKAHEYIEHFRASAPTLLARAVRESLSSLSRHISPSVLISEIRAGAVQSVLDE